MTDGKPAIRNHSHPDGGLILGDQAKACWDAGYIGVVVRVHYFLHDFTSDNIATNVFFLIRTADLREVAQRTQ
jgi:hypothetical protein